VVRMVTSVAGFSILNGVVGLAHGAKPRTTHANGSEGSRLPLVHSGTRRASETARKWPGDRNWLPVINGAPFTNRVQLVGNLDTILGEPRSVQMARFAPYCG